MTTAKNVSLHGDWGQLGTRRLVAVQHLDIGRLGSEIIPLPRNGGLVVLTGRGPAKDPSRPAGSNGASKTTLAAAIDLLLLSHSWGPRSARIHRAAPGLVFAPEDSQSRADVGWIVGTFRSDGDPDPVTVICRIKRDGDDKLRYRVLSGIHYAEGKSHGARCLDIKRVWEAGDTPPLTVERYLDDWLGNHPRSTGYVNKRGSMEADPTSIFTTELTKVTRRQVAADLIELAGLTRDIREEREARALVEENAAKVSDAVAKHKDVTAEVQARLDSYDRNAKALNDLAGAAEDRAAWEVSRLADALTETLEDARRRDALLVTDNTATLNAEVERLTDRVKALSDTDELRKALKKAAAARAAAQPGWDRVVKAQSEAETNERVIRRELANRDLLDAAAQDTGRTPDTVRADLRAADEVVAQAIEAVGAAKQAVRDAAALADAIAEGRSEAAELLRSHGIDCEVLGDAVEVSDAARASWDAVLAPWSEALVVDPADLDRAAEVVPAGTVLTGHAGTLPAGVESAPVGAAGLLTDLANHDTTPHGVAVAAPRHVVVGGWDSPRSGREARVRAAQAALEAAVDAQAQAEKKRDADQRTVKRLRSELDAVEAAGKVEALKNDLTAATQTVAAATEAVEKGRAAWDSLVAAEESATKDLEDHQDRLNEAKEALADKQEMLRLTVTEPAEALTESIRRRKVLVRIMVADSVMDGDLAATADGFDPVQPDRSQAGELIARCNDYLDVFVAAEPEENVLRADSLRRRASRKLREGLRLLGIVEDAATGAPSFQRRPDWDAEQAITRFFGPTEDITEVEEAQAVLDAARRTHDWLEPIVERETHQRDLEQERLDRATRDVDAAESQHEQVRLTSEAVKGALIDRVSMLFDQISVEFAARVRTADGIAARLEHRLVEPESSRAELRWEVAPAWARTPDGKPVPYDRGSVNTGHVKVKAFQLVLAALKGGPPGRMLLLDELTAGLDEVHIGEVLDMVKRAAADEQLTIMVALQDTAASEAVAYADELLYLHRPLMSDLLNAPTTIILSGPDDALVSVAADVAASRGELGWTPLVQDPAAWDGLTPMVPDTLEGLTDLG